MNTRPAMLFLCVLLASSASNAESGFIIANMGDQPSDLLGGHAEKKFLLPDPFYRVP
jgi:hypothetical protein